jgi:Ni,Fe-hydrogenase III small subunit
MEHALLQTYNATPNPKIVVAMGVCAISGGLFADTYVCSHGVSSVVPVDVFIPGCPPRPQAIIQGIMVALDLMESKMKKDQRDLTTSRPKE